MEIVHTYKDMMTYPISTSILLHAHNNNLNNTHTTVILCKTYIDPKVCYNRLTVCLCLVSDNY